MLALLVVLLMLSTSAAEDPGYRAEVPADKVLDMIVKEEPVNLNDVLIKGDLNLSKVEAKRKGVITTDFKITDSVIYGPVNFNSSVFDGPVSFENTEFEAPVNFIEADFRQGANFNGCHFAGPATFKKAIFNGSASFKKSRFDDQAIFWRSHFVSGAADFGYSHFGNYCCFWGSQFDCEPAIFAWSHFQGSASFWGAHFSGDTDMKGCRFADEADFTLAMFNSSADFLGSKFDKKLQFVDVKFEDLKINWASFSEKLVCNGPIYLALIKNFKDLEQFEDADSCYYEYRDWRRGNRDLGWLKFLDYLAWISCGYGVRWQHTILSGFLVVMLFGIYFEFDYLIRGAVSITRKNDAIKLSVYDLWRSIKKSFTFSVMVLLSIPSDWYPHGKDHYEKSIKSHFYAAVLERLIGWGLMLLLISTLTRLMVRY